MEAGHESHGSKASRISRKVPNTKFSYPHFLRDAAHPFLWALASDFSQPLDASYLRNCEIIPSVLAPALGLKRRENGACAIAFEPIADEKLLEFCRSHAQDSDMDDAPAKEAAQKLRSVLQLGASRGPNDEYKALKEGLETKLRFHDEARTSHSPREARDKMAWLWIARLDNDLNGGYRAQFDFELEASLRLLKMITAYARSTDESAAGHDDQMESLGTFAVPVPETGTVSLAALGDSLLLKAEVASIVDAYFIAKVRACTLLSGLASQTVARTRQDGQGRKHKGDSETFAYSNHWSENTVAQVWPLRVLWAQECLLFQTLVHQALLAPSCNHGDLLPSRFILSSFSGTLLKGLIKVGVPNTALEALQVTEESAGRDKPWNEFMQKSREIVTSTFSARTRELAVRILSRTLPHLRPSSLGHLLPGSMRKAMRQELGKRKFDKETVAGYAFIRSVMLVIGSCLIGPTSPLAGSVTNRTASSLIALVRTLATYGFKPGGSGQAAKDTLGLLFTDTWAILVRHVISKGLCSGTRVATRNATFRWHTCALKKSTGDTYRDDISTANVDLVAALAVLGGNCESLRSGVVVQVDKGLQNFPVKIAAQGDIIGLDGSESNITANSQRDSQETAKRGIAGTLGKAVGPSESDYLGVELAGSEGFQPSLFDGNAILTMKAIRAGVICATRH